MQWEGRRVEWDLKSLTEYEVGSLLRMRWGIITKIHEMEYQNKTKGIGGLLNTRCISAQYTKEACSTRDTNLYRIIPASQRLHG
jgi:hypothetical protein